jgi:hypothetical protein
MRTVRRRPSLVRTAARTAVIAGTATAVSGNVARNQQQAAQQQAAAKQAQVDAAVQQAMAQQAPAQPPPMSAPPAGDLVAQLQQLADLRTAGVLSDVEFEAAKAKLLNG